MDLANLDTPVIVVDLDQLERNVLPGTRVEALWEEHGVLRLDDAGRELEVGDILDIIPNHVCPTVNLADKWYGVRAGKVEKEYWVAARGRAA